MYKYSQIDDLILLFSLPLSFIEFEMRYPSSSERHGILFTKWASTEVLTAQGPTVTKGI